MQCSQTEPLQKNTQIQLDAALSRQSELEAEIIKLKSVNRDLKMVHEKLRITADDYENIEAQLGGQQISEAKLSQLEATNSALSNQLSAKESEISSLKSRIAEVQASQETLEETLKVHQGQLEAARSAQSKLEKDVSQLGVSQIPIRAHFIDRSANTEQG